MGRISAIMTVQKKHQSNGQFLAFAYYSLLDTLVFICGGNTHKKQTINKYLFVFIS